MGSGQHWFLGDSSGQDGELPTYSAGGEAVGLVKIGRDRNKQKEREETWETLCLRGKG